MTIRNNENQIWHGNGNTYIYTMKQNKNIKENQMKQELKKLYDAAKEKDFFGILSDRERLLIINMEHNDKFSDELIDELLEDIRS